tara:strand:+ start:61 stop:750 length:690 start_codon:yes stop_codon:yes gene_type:complete
MKITKSKLKEIIREMVEEELNIPIWEQNLPESWFQDLKAKAQKAYIKANPNSKYAKGVKSGEKEAPMTKKDKTKKAEKEKRDKQKAMRAKKSQEHKKLFRQNKEAIKQYKNIDWEEEQDGDELRDSVNAFQAMRRISNKDAAKISDEVSEFQEEQMQDEPNFDKLNFQQDKIRKLMTKAIKDRAKATAERNRDDSDTSSSGGSSGGSSSRGGFGSDVGATTRGLGGGIF